MNTQLPTQAQTEQNQINNPTTSSELTNDQLIQIANFEADISDEEMMRIETASNDEARGLQRRICLLVCARSADQLFKLSEEPDYFTEMVEDIKSFKDHAEMLAEIAETALFRMQIAECFYDRQQAKAEPKQTNNL